MKTSRAAREDAVPILYLVAFLGFMTNPAGFVFPKEDNGQPFDLFREDQKEELESFLEHRQPDLEISGWRRFANLLSLSTPVFSILSLRLEVVKGSLRVRQEITHQDYAQEKRVI